MSALQKALVELQYRIPRAILETVFRDNRTYRWRSGPADVSELILNRVLKPRVLVDCNLVGGAEMLIALENVHVEVLDNITSVFHIPKDITQGRTITTALSIGYGNAMMLGQPSYTSAFKPCSITPSLQVGASMMDRHQPIPISGTARVQLIAENTIMVRDSRAVTGAVAYLRCIVANDDELSHLQLRSYIDFAKLCELAVKSYIYNEYFLLIDRAQIAGGYDLGSFKEVVNGYADSEEMYQTFLRETWTAVAFMNDMETHARHITRIVGPGI